MAGKKKEKLTVRGDQLLARGDIIRMSDQGALVQCRVLSCITGEQGSCYASLEILEGERKGERINATLRATENTGEDIPSKAAPKG